MKNLNNVTFKYTEGERRLSKLKLSRRCLKMSEMKFILLIVISLIVRDKLIMLAEKFLKSR